MLLIAAAAVIWVTVAPLYKEYSQEFKD
jgi:hypothetical protein